MGARKFIFTLLILISSFLLPSCGVTTTKTEDRKGPIIEGLVDAEVEFASDFFQAFDPWEGVVVRDKIDGVITNERYLDVEKINYYRLGKQIITYTAWNSRGERTQGKRTITVVPNGLDTRYTDSLKLTADYEGKTFTQDGIGLVTLVSCVDGDTARFSDGVEYNFSLRFLGIDTPENSSIPEIGYEPWGKDASNYTCAILRNAKKIVLEGEGTLKETFGRYLGYVWVDMGDGFKMLNMELVEQAYTRGSVKDTSKYFQDFLWADLKASGSGKRIYGEIDPNYDYENKRFR